MKSAISPVITLKSKKIKSISSYLFNQEEIIYASKAQLNYHPDRNLPDENCYIILTYGFIYLFIKENKELKLKQQICTLRCQEIQYINEEDTESKPTISLITDSDLNTFTISNGENMEIFYRYLYYSIFIISGGLYSYFSLPILTPKIQMKFFSVSFCIYKRFLYLIHLDMKQENIPNSEIVISDYFDDPNVLYRGQLLINQNFHPGFYSNYYGRAIGLEPRLLVVVFSNFSEEFVVFLESILINSRKIIQIKFTDYKTDNAPPFNFEKVTKTSIEKFQFANSNFSLINNFMNGLVDAKFDVHKIKFTSIKMNQSDLLNFFDQMNKIQSFNNLVSFSLFDIIIGQIKEFPIKILGQFLESHQKIESITLSNVNVEGSKALEEICRCSLMIYEIHLNRLNFDLPLAVEGGSIKLPCNVVTVDFSRSRFKNLTLAPILELLTSSESESNGLIVNMSYLEPRDLKFINAYKAMETKKCHPNICEVNWSGNHLSPDLFRFLATQKQLRFMSLMDLSIQKQASFFQLLRQVVWKSRLKGIELGSDSFDPEFAVPFIESLKEREELEYFRFHCQPNQEKLGHAIVDLIESHPNLKEVAIDMKSLSPELFLQLENVIVSSASIKACSLTRCEIKEEHPSFRQVASMMKKILNLKVPSTIEQRTIDAIERKKKEELNVERAFEDVNFDNEYEEEECNN